LLIVLSFVETEFVKPANPSPFVLLIVLVFLLVQEKRVVPTVVVEVAEPVHPDKPVTLLVFALIQAIHTLSHSQSSISLEPAIQSVESISSPLKDPQLPLLPELPLLLCRPLLLVSLFLGLVMPPRHIQSLIQLPRQ